MSVHWAGETIVEGVPCTLLQWSSKVTRYKYEQFCEQSFQKQSILFRPDVLTWRHTTEEKKRRKKKLLNCSCFCPPPMVCCASPPLLSLCLCIINLSRESQRRTNFQVHAMLAGRNIMSSSTFSLRSSLSWRASFTFHVYIESF